jgi:hypothetical protein
VARVLKRSGYLLAAVPAPDDLVELRSAVQGEARPRERTAALVAEHEPDFSLVERFEVRERAHLDRATLLDLLRATYRGERASASDRIASLSQLDVTIASDCVVMKLAAAGHSLTKIGLRTSEKRTSAPGGCRQHGGERLSLVLGCAI